MYHGTYDVVETVESFPQGRHGPWGRERMNTWVVLMFDLERL